MLWNKYMRKIEFPNSLFRQTRLTNALSFVDMKNYSLNGINSYYFGSTTTDLEVQCCYLDGERGLGIFWSLSTPFVLLIVVKWKGAVFLSHGPS